MVYKKRCMIIGCDKKAIEKNGNIYLCKFHKSKRLDSKKEYLLKNMKKLRIVNAI